MIRYKKITVKENSKITLTFGQLKRLLKESAEGSSDVQNAYDEFLYQLHAAVENGTIELGFSWDQLKFKGPAELLEAQAKMQQASGNLEIDMQELLMIEDLSGKPLFNPKIANFITKRLASSAKKVTFHNYPLNWFSAGGEHVFDADGGDVEELIFNTTADSLKVDVFSLFRLNKLKSLRCNRPVIYAVSSVPLRKETYKLPIVNEVTPGVFVLDGVLLRVSPRVSGDVDVSAANKDIFPGAFWNCDKITSITCSPEIKELGPNIFRNNYALREVNAPGASVSPKCWRGANRDVLNNVTWNVADSANAPKSFPELYRVVDDDYQLLLRYYKRTNQVKVGWKARTRNGLVHPMYVNFKSEEDAKKFLTKMGKDPSANKIYRVKNDSAREEQVEVDTPYGKCLTGKWKWNDAHQ